MNERQEPSDYSSFLARTLGKNVSAIYQLINATQNYIAGLSRYAGDFMIPYLISTSYFKKAENENRLVSSRIRSMLHLLLIRNNLHRLCLSG